MTCSCHALRTSRRRALGLVALAALPASGLLAGEQVRAIKAVYVQDMGQAQWDDPKGHWIDAKAAVYVLGSKRHGSMGPTIASFAQEQDAAKFAQEYGGKVLRFADIKPDMVDLSGGALHDSRM